MLGPLPFLIYINDIYASAPDVSFHLLADDTCLSNCIKANKLTLNFKKKKSLTDIQH